MLALGLMSGTSRDGIDAALIETDGVAVTRRGAWLTCPYDDAFRARLAAVCREGADAAETAAVATDLTRRHAAAVARLLAAALAAAPVAVIGFHGHTVLHRPERRLTRQIGDGQMLADLTGVPVVADFRTADVAAGGQGAPLAPLYHAALVRDEPRPVAVLNIGGVANLTYVGPEAEPTVIGFDTGPGGALLDDWVARATGAPFDADGRLAAAGHVDGRVLAALLEHPYFGRPPPKSLDRDDFSLGPVHGLSAADGAATLTAFTARAVAAALAHLPARPRRWIAVGGGRHNPVLLAALRHHLAAPVVAAEAVGWRGDALEAEAFAFLAVRATRGLPLSLPTTTGVPAPMPGGRLYRPAAAI